MVITYISVVYFILSTKSNNVRSNRIIYLQQSTIDYNMFCFVLLRVQGGGRGGGEVCAREEREEITRSDRGWGREGKGVGRQVCEGCQMVVDAGLSSFVLRYSRYS